MADVNHGEEFPQPRRLPGLALDAKEQAHPALQHQSLDGGQGRHASDAGRKGRPLEPREPSHDPPLENRRPTFNERSCPDGGEELPGRLVCGLLHPPEKPPGTNRRKGQRERLEPPGVSPEDLAAGREAGHADLGASQDAALEDGAGRVHARPIVARVEERRRSQKVEGARRQPAADPVLGLGPLAKRERGDAECQHGDDTESGRQGGGDREGGGFDEQDRAERQGPRGIGPAELRIPERSPGAHGRASQTGISLRVWVHSGAGGMPPNRGTSRRRDTFG